MTTHTLTRMYESDVKLEVNAKVFYEAFVLSLTYM